MKKMPATTSSADVENQPPPLHPLRGVTTAKQPRAATGGEEAGRTSGRPLKEVPAEESVAPEDVPFNDAASAQAGEQAKPTTGKKCSSGQMSFSSKILLCGGGSGQERESKRKEVDENNPLAQNPADASGSSRSRKSSRKGSKKKSKDTIPMSSLDPAKEEADPGTADPNAVPEPSEAKEGSIAGKTSQNSNKSCCFCWCCCCSCSCLSVKNGKGTKESNNKNELSSLEHFFRGNDDQLPSPEEIKSWGESFDKLMKCPWGRKVFREFLKCEYSEENILFWLACEDLKNETDPKLIEEKCRAIYDDYISILSPKEVSLDSQVREIINKNMMNPSKETFAEGQLQIYTLMHRDSYPRFVNSTHYKQILEVQADTQSRPAQSAG